MLKYILACLLCAFGIAEVILALNGSLREAVMRNSLVRSKRAEAPVLLVAGLSALAMGLGMLCYGFFW
jgi:hypothetical protein